ncbi:hybrid sensor histidine kinase/response regulator [Rhodosalinus halophilus]|uniref:histidine kinase n=1 Tax=Rhodosalinus halophilus TaxID=2259333 RepID=A0A365U9A2_9RHOB|nr:PAS-domain containing protein [Rhodosalinus halophilus]RBI85590.1 hybrid sensor histidine kinase/response regulator [Rhodosalinus halophilus]
MAARAGRTEALMTAGLNLIQQALSIYDSDLRLAACNRRFQEMFDLPDRLVEPGARFEDTIRFLVERGEYGPVDDAEEAIRARVEIARRFQPHYMERTRANGQTISVEGSPLPEGGWVTVYTDITPAKQHEAMLRARSEELSEQLVSHAEELAAANRQLAATNAALEEASRELAEIEARTRMTAEMMPAHIAHVDAERRYTYSNRRLSSVLPGRPRDILGRPIAEALGGAAYARIAPHLDAAFDGRESVFEFTDEISSRRIRVAFTPDRRDSGIEGVYILSMDVTEETQARAALQQTRRREMAAQLTSGLAHDFSNLLTIILGSQSRLAALPMPAEARPMIDATLAAARRGGTLLERLAQLTGARDWTPQPCDTDAFLSDLETLARAALPAQVTLTMRNEMPGERLLLDPGLVQDALLNLILNARDACGGAGRISVTLAALQGTWAEFSVTDTGPGFSDAALKRGCEPFYTTKGGEGSGLGLAMVYDMAKLAGGRVILGNSFSGARVALRLPLRAAPARGDGRLVLLVEDSPDLRASVREMLTGLGHAVVEAASAAEARALAETLPEIGAVLTDLTLEGAETGLDLARALGAEGPPVWFMTALPPDHPLHAEARAQGPVLTKPFGAEALARALGVGLAA